MLKKVKAKVVDVLSSFWPVIYVGGRWRSLATPYSPKKEDMMPYTNKPTAKRAAEKVAKALGIKLEWED